MISGHMYVFNVCLPVAPKKSDQAKANKTGLGGSQVKRKFFLDVAWLSLNETRMKCKNEKKKFLEL